MREKTEIILFNSNSMQFIGGGEFTTRMLYDGLKKKGYSLHIAVPRSSDGLSTTQYLQSNNNKKYIAENREFLTFNGVFSFLYRPLPSLQSFSRDGINLVFVSRIPPRRYLIKLENSGIKVVFLLHGIAIEKIRFNNLKVTFYQIFLRIKFRTMLSSVRTSSNLYLQVLNGRISDYITKKRVPSTKVFLIPTGLPVDEYLIEKNDEDFIILYMGRINDTQKNASLFIHFARRILSRNVRMVKVIMVGPIEDQSMANHISDLHEEYPTRFSYLGVVDEDVKINLLRKCSLFISTSHLEPYSLSVVEALSSGIPVLTTPASGPSFILSFDRNFGKISSFNIKDLVREAEHYMAQWEKNPSSFYKMRESIRASALEHFKFEHMITCYSDMIDKISKSDHSDKERVI